MKTTSESGRRVHAWRGRLRLAIIYIVAFVLSAYLNKRLGFFTSSSSPYSHSHLQPLSQAVPLSAHLTSESHRASLLSKCLSLKTPAGPPADFHLRTESDRFQAGTPPVLIANARIWTAGEEGREVVRGSVLMDKGIIKAVRDVTEGMIEEMVGREEREGMVRIDAEGAWVTPGLVDLHSHIGVGSLPGLNGASDTNSLSSPILPHLRALDALNTHDLSYALALAGGVTSAQILPGSANNIGGQAFVIKLRETNERSPSSRVVEMPGSVKGMRVDGMGNGTVRWRHMKHACGENPSRVHHLTRPDSAWHFRHAYDTARKIKEAQDQFCSEVVAGRWDELGELDGLDELHLGELHLGEGNGEDGLGERKEKAVFPEELEWEALVDVLRGRVKLSVHCYEAVDLDAIVRLSHEFQFPIASFHHAGETYLVPDLLKKTFGGTPTIALFASNFRKKREAYRGSEFAPTVLAEHGIPVVMKSDHPVVNSRYLLNEASTAFYYGLPAHLALGSVTSVPARALGMGHRIGYVKEGYDADLVLWDSHPLSLGSTPLQVFVDGIPQLPANPSIVSRKPSAYQEEPRVPDFRGERERAVEEGGLPGLEGRRLETRTSGSASGERERYLAVVGVRRRFEKVERGGRVGVEEVLRVREGEAGEEYTGILVSSNGSIVCEWKAAANTTTNTSISQSSCISNLDPHLQTQIETLDLHGGTLLPALTTFGSPIGLSEIRLEPSTNDGVVWDAMSGGGELPEITGGYRTVVRAVDGVRFGGRNMLLAYRAGVSTAIIPPVGRGLILGVSTAISAGARNVLEKGAVLEREVALHFQVGSPGGYGAGASVSSQVAVLRRLLLGKEHEHASGRELELEDGQYEESLMGGGNQTVGGAGYVHVFERARKGQITLVFHVDSADIMATLIRLKREFETEKGFALPMTFAEASEAHLLAREIAEAGVSVILSPSHPFPGTWDARRILPGPPLSRESAITELMAHGVNVAIGVPNEYEARNTRFNMAWAALESHSQIGFTEAIALVTTNLDKALGLKPIPSNWDDVVAYDSGDVFNFEAKPVAVFSPRRGVVDLF